MPFYPAKVALLQGNRPSITPIFQAKNDPSDNPATDYQQLTKCPYSAVFEAKGELGGKYRAVEHE